MIVVFCYLVAIYYQIKIVHLDDLMPKEATHQKDKSITLATKYYGNWLDKEIINLNKALKLFNVLVNEIVTSIKIAFHHVACLTSASALIYLVIKYIHVIAESGLIAIFIIGCCLISPLAIIASEKTMFAMLANISDCFIEVSKNLTRRKKMYRKFVISCQKFYVEEAFPFYKIGRNTFLEFCAQALDKSITLLL